MTIALVLVFVAVLVVFLALAWGAKTGRRSGRRGEIKIGGPMNQDSHEGPKVGRAPGPD